MVACVCEGELLSELANNATNSSEANAEVTSQLPEFDSFEFGVEHGHTTVTEVCIVA